jgi:hypothetical protein
MTNLDLRVALVREILLDSRALSLSKERVRERCGARRSHHFQIFEIE